MNRPCILFDNVNGGKIFAIVDLTENIDSFFGYSIIIRKKKRRFGGGLGSADAYDYGKYTKTHLAPYGGYVQIAQPLPSAQFGHRRPGKKVGCTSHHHQKYLERCQLEYGN